MGYALESFNNSIDISISSFLGRKAVHSKMVFLYLFVAALTSFLGWGYAGKYELYS